MILIILLVISIYFLYYNKKQNIKIIFYSSNDIMHKLNDKFQNYYNNMDDNNMKLRKINDKDLFLNNLYKCFYNCDEYEKYILKDAIDKAHNKLNKINCHGFHPYKLNDIPWKIGFSYLYEYEFGLPHTHNDIIILNKDNIYENDLVTILMHERIHIYQRLFPEDIEDYLLYNNFERIAKKTDIDRVNPDTDEYVYIQDGLIYECKIDNNKIKCTKNNSKYEHPFEYMAYTLSESL